MNTESSLELTIEEIGEVLFPDKNDPLHDWLIQGLQHNETTYSISVETLKLLNKTQTVKILGKIFLK